MGDGRGKMAEEDDRAWEARLRRIDAQIERAYAELEAPAVWETREGRQRIATTLSALAVVFTILGMALGGLAAHLLGTAP